MKKNSQLTIKEKKDKAIEVMKKLKINEPYIQGFEQEDKVCFYEMYAGYWVYQEPKTEAKMKEIENKYKCKVFAITHEITNIGELWDFLIVSNHRKEWKDMIYSNGNKHTLIAYVWNKSDDQCSEFGDITVQSRGGGIRRVA